MPTVPFIPENAPFTSEQRAWLNGFLAGLFSQVQAAWTAQLTEANPPANEPLLVLFGSQTGSAEALAKRFAKESESRGFSPKLLALNDYERANLAAGGKAVIICSTWGDGHPPDNAANFWNWLRADSAPRLDKLSFAVLGLGDKNYSEFCGASKKFDTRLEALGANRLAERGECDVEYEAAATAWIGGVWDKLTTKEPVSKNSLTVSVVNQASNASHPPKTPSNPAVYGKTNPCVAKLLKNLLLNKPGSGKEIRHYEIAAEKGALAYQPGDALGVLPANCPGLVHDIIAALKGDPQEEVAVGDRVLSLRDWLTHHLDITKPSQELLAAVAKAVPQSELARFLSLEKREELKNWLWGRHVIDLLQMLPAPMGSTEFVSLAKRLSPRLYSISSSPKAHPGEVHLTVSAVRYESHGRARKGVASTFLADRIDREDFMKVYVQPSPGFKPPSNGDLSMIMVGPGTGIAPFRAFLEERFATDAKGRNWLFFGDQRRATDFLYEEQLTSWHASGFLTRLELAFSRDQERKSYVQDRMLENAGELWKWLEEGAHFYVCGDANRMAKDVDATLHKIVETAGTKSAEEAKAYVAKMKSEKRYQRDVY